MDRYDLTQNELAQALGRMFTRVADTNEPGDRAVLYSLIVLAQVPDMGRYSLWNVDADAVTRLDWALER
jgi:hypothetical protein